MLVTCTYHILQVHYRYALHTVADPAPYQNDTDPPHWVPVCTKLTSYPINLAGCHRSDLLPHLEHWKGLSLLWEFMWISRTESRSKARLQTGQMCLRSWILHRQYHVTVAYCRSSAGQWACPTYFSSRHHDVHHFLNHCATATTRFSQQKLSLHRISATTPLNFSVTPPHFKKIKK